MRQLVREWAVKFSLSSNDEDQRAGFFCYDDLRNRGDAFAVSFFLDYRTEVEDHIYVRVTRDRLSELPRENVACEIRRRLNAARSVSEQVRLVYLLGRFGTQDDEAAIRPHLESQESLLANVACEAILNLTDPALVPERWASL